MDNEKELFRELQKDIEPLSHMELLKEPIRQVNADRAQFEQEDSALMLQVFGIPVLIIASLIIWKLIVPNGMVDALTGISGISILTKPLCWEGRWYINIIFHIVVDGFLSIVELKKLYRLLNSKGTKRLKEIENRKQELVTQYKEKEESLGAALQKLPSYYRDYITVAGIVGAYNLGYANDLQTALAYYETHLSDIEKLEEASMLDIDLHEDAVRALYYPEDYATNLWMKNRAYERYLINKEFTM